jgi:hypothetical protein
MAAPVLPPLLRDGDRLTRDQFLRRWEQMPEVKHAELIDGIVYMPAPVSKVHRNFHFQLSGWRAGAPELIVEISHTTGDKDKGAKLRLYERSAVREYITVRPGKRQLIWREFDDGRYRDLLLDREGLFRSHIFPGLWLNPAALWARDLAGLSATVQQGLATSEHAAFVERLACAKRGC